VQAGRRPLLVVACVGSAVFGQNDLISKLLELRAEYGFWLHVGGHGLAAMATSQPGEHLVVCPNLIKYDIELYTENCSTSR
jgi:glutamate/tyrosine decarboxylase-like PLP-dependent enzyme